MTTRWLIWSALCALAIGCSSSEGSDSGAATSATDGTDGASATSSTDGVDGTDGTDGASATDGTDGTDGTTSQKCTNQVRAYGYAQTELGDIVYQNNGLTLTAGHAAGGECTNAVNVAFDINGGCTLSFDATTAGGFWTLTGGSFAPDANCGEFWDPADTVTFELSVDDSRFGVRQAPDVIETADGQCGQISDEEPMFMTGFLRFIAKGAGTDGQDRAIQVTINDLGVTGSYLAEATNSAECPSEPRLCQGIECGLDYFGAQCGGCAADGLTCIGGACVEGGCQPTSTKTGLGDAIGDQKFTESNGEVFNLHSACGSSAVFLLKTAHW